MKIVVLDGYTLNPGDLSWNKMEQLGNLTIYERTAADKVYERAKDAAIVLTNKTPISPEVINKLPSLKYIGVLATGYNVVDVEAAKHKGILVTNVPGYGPSSVAQLTFALLLELCQHVQRHSDAVMEGKWARSADWCFWDYPLVELAGKTIGIIGFGTIGQKVADIATAFGMKIVGESRTQSDQSNRKNFKWVSLEELFQVSDVISIHCPLTPETKGLINKATLQKMKPSTFLLNTSRGPIIVDQDLADALNNNVIAGAGIDVLSTEPPPIDNPLFKAKNCLITPHLAWATKEARTRLMNSVVENVSAFLSGKPVNVVNK
jgi:glycerate dehydrogenase